MIKSPHARPIIAVDDYIRAVPIGSSPLLEAAFTESLDLLEGAHLDLTQAFARAANSVDKNP